MKKLSIILAMSMMLAPLAACGSGKTTPSKTEGGTSPKTEQSQKTTEGTQKERETITETTADQSLKGKLSIGLPGAFEVTNEEVVQNFIKANPDLKVEIDSGPWGDYVKKIQTLMASGTAPDLWFQENAVILGNGAKGAAVDLADLIKNDLDAEQYSVSLFASKSGDHVWGVPHDVNNIALAYNKDLFDEAGIAYPDENWTYQDMYDAAAKLTQGDDDASKTWGYLYQGSITVGWFPFGKIYGGQILNEDKTKSVLDDNYWKGIEFAAKFVSEGISPDSTLMRELGGSRPLFGNGKAAMMFLTFSTVKPILDEFPNLNWDVVTMPKGFDGNRVVPSVTNSWMIYSRAKDEGQANAWAFLKHYLSEESQNIIAKTGTSLPDMISSQQVLLDSITKPDISAFTKGLEYAVTLDENPSWNAWRGVVQSPSMDITNGLAELTEEMKEAARVDTQSAIDTWNAENILN